MQDLTFRAFRKDNIYFRMIEEREKITSSSSSSSSSSSVTVITQGQLLEGVECHIYLYCFTFDDINLNRVWSLLSYFQKKI